MKLMEIEVLIDCEGGGREVSRESAYFLLLRTESSVRLFAS